MKRIIGTRDPLQLLCHLPGEAACLDVTRHRREQLSRYQGERLCPADGAASTGGSGEAVPFGGWFPVVEHCTLQFRLRRRSLGGKINHTFSVLPGLRRTRCYIRDNIRRLAVSSSKRQTVSRRTMLDRSTHPDDTPHPRDISR